MELRKTNIETVPINEYCVKSDSLDTNVPRQTYETIEQGITFRPIDTVRRISPRPILFIGAEKGSVTPVNGIEAMYTKAVESKKYEVFGGIGHYEVYGEPHVSRMIKLTDDWIKIT